MAPGRSRDNPAVAKFIGRRRLNKQGSEKDTWHLDFDLTEFGLDYVVGDAFGDRAEERSGAGRAGDRSAEGAARLRRLAAAACGRF